MERNIRLNYGFSFFQFIGLTSLWVFYLSQKGFSAVEIGMMEAVFHSASFCFEVPSGGLADRLGYRNVLILSRVANSISCLFIVASTSFVWVTIGFIFSALSYNLASGTNEALVYESLKNEKKEQRYLTVWSTTTMIMEIASSVGMVLAGLLSMYYFDGVYWIQLAMNGCAILLACWMVDPKRPQNQHTIRQVMKHAVAEVKKSPKLVRFMLSFAFVDACRATYVLYVQSYFETLAINGFGLSLLLVISSVFQVVSVRLAPKLVATYSLPVIYLSNVLLTAVAIASSGSVRVGIVLASFFVANALEALMYPIQSNVINQLIQSDQRATVNSISSLCYSLVMIPVFPIVGWFIEATNYAPTYLWLGLLVGLCGSYLALKFKRVEGEDKKK